MGFTVMSKKRQLSSSQIITLSFAGAILIGSLLLELPWATQDGHRAAYADALFTSASAVCVTGLVVQDTATYWSDFGQAVILLLIQIGGLGLVTLTAAFFTISGKKIGLQQRSTLQEAVAAPTAGGLVQLVGFILKTAIIAETLGTLAMAPVFCQEFGFLRGLWYAGFHSVSAFCNAGFDLMGIHGQYSSLTFYASNIPINVAIMSLIIFGGVGFLTWDDIKNNRLKIRRYRMQSKIILTMTALLILVPALYLFFFEFSSLPMQERLMQSLFQSVTTRTAGFNTADMGSISETGLAVMTTLMIIGGSPGSTAGGIKTTAFAVLLSTAVAVFHKRENIHFFGRRVPEDTVRRAATLLTMYLILFLSGGLIISRVEGLPLLNCLYEAASAVGTVGLTMGLTPKLSLLSRTILIGLMYIGRTGGLTLLFSAVTGDIDMAARLPQEKLAVG